MIYYYAITGNYKILSDNNFQYVDLKKSEIFFKFMSNKLMTIYWQFGIIIFYFAKKINLYLFNLQICYLVFNI